MKEVVKVKETYVNMMSYPQCQDASASNILSKPLMKRQKKNHHSKDSLINLKGFVGCLKPQVLVDNRATLSFIYEMFAQRLPLTYYLRKLIITLGNGHVWNTKRDVSLELKLADGMKLETEEDQVKELKLMLVDLFMILQSTLDLTPRS